MKEEEFRVKEYLHHRDDTIEACLFAIQSCLQSASMTHRGDRVRQRYVMEDAVNHAEALAAILRSRVSFMKRREE